MLKWFVFLLIQIENSSFGLIRGYLKNIFLNISIIKKYFLYLSKQ
jgi:hypothetical protein